MSSDFEIDLEALRRVKRKAWLYAKIFGSELYEKIYRILDSVEKRLGEKHE
jgi:hypothetical protein